jgi:hypothetical protein
MASGFSVAWQFTPREQLFFSVMDQTPCPSWQCLPRAFGRFCHHLFLLWDGFYLAAYKWIFVEMRGSSSFHSLVIEIGWLHIHVCIPDTWIMRRHNWNIFWNAAPFNRAQDFT